MGSALAADLDREQSLEAMRHAFRASKLAAEIVAERQKFGAFAENAPRRADVSKSIAPLA
jgi:hypothetical protein